MQLLWSLSVDNESIGKGVSHHVEKLYSKIHLEITPPTPLRFRGKQVPDLDLFQAEDPPAP